MSTETKLTVKELAIAALRACEGQTLSPAQIHGCMEAYRDAHGIKVEGHIKSFLPQNWLGTSEENNNQSIPKMQHGRLFRRVEKAKYLVLSMDEVRLPEKKAKQVEPAAVAVAASTEPSTTVGKEAPKKEPEPVPAPTKTKKKKH